MRQGGSTALNITDIRDFPFLPAKQRRYHDHRFLHQVVTTGKVMNGEPSHVTLLERIVL